MLVLTWQWKGKRCKPLFQFDHNCMSVNQGPSWMAAYPRTQHFNECFLDKAESIVSSYFFYIVAHSYGIRFEQQKASQSWCNFVLFLRLFISNSLDMHLHVIFFHPTNNDTKNPITSFRLRNPLTQIAREKKMQGSWVRSSFIHPC